MYLRMNEEATSGDVTALDASGNGNHATSNNSVLSTTGIRGNARQFVAANTEWLSIPYSTAMDFGETAYTLSFWFNVSLSVQTSWIIGNDNSNTTNLRGFFINASTANTRSVQLQPFAGGSQLFSSAIGSDASITQNAWHFVWLRHAQNSAVMELGLYTATGFRATSSVTRAGGATWNNPNSPVNIGRRGTGANYFSGNIDEVCKWTRALTDAELDLVFNNGAGIDIA
jgi:hypothetical protein